MLPARLVILLALFFCSGACGLVYQVLWLRQLSLVFGFTVYAASTVLAAFMTGLALGSLAAGPLLRRVQRPLFAFAIAEIGIGISALATPAALAAADAIYGGLHDIVARQPIVMTLARLIGSFVVLLVPTFLMGLTLPIVSASSVVRGVGLGARVSLLYAVNTAGAMTGVLAAGFYLIGGIGIRGTFLAAATVNALVGLAALWLAREGDSRATGTATTAVPTDQATATSLPARTSRAHTAVAFVVLVSGFTSLALEVVWFRVLLQFVPATTYAFTTMLATVLGGIALGGALAARLLRRDRDWLRALTAVSMATGIAAVASMVVLAWSYERGWHSASAFYASVAAILPAAICMGLALPMALRLAALRDAGPSATAVARGIGRLYALNVIGAIAGALAGGFVFLPLFGSHRALIVLAAFFVVAGLALILVHPSRRRMLTAATVGVALFSIAAARVPDPLDVTFERRHGGGLREIFRDDGAQTTVTVYANQFRRVMFLDGLHQANDEHAMVQMHATIGHLPMVLHPAPADVLVVGLGGGVTAGAASQHAGSRVRVVELSDGVRRAADLFSHVNFDVLRNPNVRLEVDDGRNYLKLTRDRYDVVTADIIQPIHAGAGSLYSREYFSLVRDSLRPGGLFMQWIGRREAGHYRLIMRTFVDVFPHATLWREGDFMIGSLGPIVLTPGRVAAARRDPRTARALDAIGLSDDETLRSWFTGGADEMRRFVGDGPVLTDDRPLIEYHRSLGESQPLLDIEALRGDVSQVQP
jgi:spermidine synthase